MSSAERRSSFASAATRGSRQTSRAAVADDTTGAALERTLATARAAGVETFGEALKTAPRGYPRDHPRVALLRHKMLVAGRRLDARPRGIARDAALDHARATGDACSAMNAWLHDHVGASELLRT